MQPFVVVYGCKALPEVHFYMTRYHSSYETVFRSTLLDPRFFLN